MLTDVPVRDGPDQLFAEPKLDVLAKYPTIAGDGRGLSVELDIFAHVALGEAEWPKIKRTAVERAAGNLYRRADGLLYRARKSE